MSHIQHFKVIGLMSGTSLDGLDIAYCEFKKEDEKWGFELLQSTTVEYPISLEEKLKTAQSMSALDFVKLDVELGEFFGKQTKIFIEKHRLSPTLIASHGHTIFHEPEKGVTTQIGSGIQINAITGIQTVADFRSNDVALGGQGAPLVPVGDLLLFPEYDYCINLGGFANISYGNPRTAFDICPINYVLNHYIFQYNGATYDKGGELAQSGKCNNALLEELNSLDYFQTAPPKSLGREWVEENVFPLIDNSGLSINDILHTYCVHAAKQIKEVISTGNVVFTGGGVFNTFLMDCISNQLSTNVKVIIPDDNIVNYKEALIFAFLGLLKMKGIPNCLQSVTGASKDNIGGVLIG